MLDNNADRSPKLNLLIGVLFGCLTSLVGGFACATEAIVISGGAVIDAIDEKIIRNATIVISEDRIMAVGPAKEIKLPPEPFERIDAKGKYIIPGLMDANVHLGLSHNLSLEAVVRYDERFDEIILEAAQFALKGGLTTVFDTWGPLPQLKLVRDRINSGEAVGSRMFVGGNVIGSNGIFNGRFLKPGAEDHVSTAFQQRIDERYQQGMGLNLQFLSPGELEAAVEGYIEKDVDLLKYMADIATMTGLDASNMLVFSPRQQQAIIQTGGRAGLSVQAHVTSEEAIVSAIDSGLRFLTHGEAAIPPHIYSDDTISMIVENQVAVSLLPFTERRFKAHESYAKEKHAELVWLDLYRTMRENRRNLIRAGAKILLSTDAHLKHPDLPELSPWALDIVDSDRNIGEAHFNALQALEEDGMEPFDILRAATVNIAETYHVDKDLGSIEEGKIADMVILDKNPLSDAKNYRLINLVIKDGKPVDRDSLPTSPIITDCNIERADWYE